MIRCRLTLALGALGSGRAGETSQACLAHRLGADLVDEVWVASEYCREVFQRITDKPVIVLSETAFSRTPYTEQFLAEAN